MNVLIQFLHNHALLPAEKRFEHYYYNVYNRKGWYGMTLEELDKVPSMEGNDKMKTSVQLLKLADAYWYRYQEHYGSEGTSRGPELQQQAYNLLCEKLGPWSSWTRFALMTLCRWDISGTEQTKIADEILAYVEQKNGNYRGWDLPLMEAAILCCLRNDDYSDNVLALQRLWIQSRPTQEMSWSARYKRLFRIHLGRQEWVEAENLVKKYFESKLGLLGRGQIEAGVYADLGEAQIRQGKLVDGEATLHKGVVVEETDEDLWIDQFSCHENLIDLYMQQERWTEAIEQARYLIQTREDQISATQSGNAPYYWDIATQRAARIITISWWRVSWERRRGPYWPDTDPRVHYLHALYNNKRKLAMIHTQLKKYDEAQRLLEELVENKMHIENPILIASKELLMTVFIQLGEWDKAEKMQEKTVDAMTERFGYDSEKLIPALEKLADIYQKNNRLGKRHHVKIRLLRYR